MITEVFIYKLTLNLKDLEPIENFINTIKKIFYKIK